MSTQDDFESVKSYFERFTLQTMMAEMTQPAAKYLQDNHIPIDEPVRLIQHRRTASTEEYLKSAGLDFGPDRALRSDDWAEEMDAAANVLFYAHCIEQNRAAGKVDDAICNTIRMTKASILLQIKPLEPMLDAAAKQQDWRKKGGQRRGEERRVQNEVRDAEIVRAAQQLLGDGYSYRDLSGILSRRTFAGEPALTPHSIRLILQREGILPTTSFGSQDETEGQND